MALDTLVKRSQSGARSWNRDIIDMVVMGVASAAILVPLFVYGPCTQSKLQRAEKEQQTPGTPTRSTSTEHSPFRQEYEETRRDPLRLRKQYDESNSRDQAMTISPPYREIHVSPKP